MAVAVAELGHPPGASYQLRAELTPPQTLEDFIASIQHRDSPSLSPFGQDPDDLVFTIPQFYQFFRDLKAPDKSTFLNWEPRDTSISELAAFSGFKVLNGSELKPNSVAVAYYRSKNPEKLVDFVRQIRPLLVPHGRAVLLVPSERQVNDATDMRGIQKVREVYDFFEADTILPIIYPGKQKNALLAAFRLLPFSYVHQ